VFFLVTQTPAWTSRRAATAVEHNRQASAQRSSDRLLTRRREKQRSRGAWLHRAP
jgi:hypothetical protein